jgi:hypothetical protein
MSVFKSATVSPWSWCWSILGSSEGPLTRPIKHVSTAAWIRQPQTLLRRGRYRILRLLSGLMEVISFLSECSILTDVVETSLITMGRCGGRWYLDYRLLRAPKELSTPLEQCRVNDIPHANSNYKFTVWQLRAIKRWQRLWPWMNE